MKNFDKLIVSSRIRLARNMARVPFASKKIGEFEPIANTILDKNPGFVVASIATLKPQMAKALSEQHLISRMLLENRHNGMLVVDNTTKEELSESARRICIMLGEEDHIRIQCIEIGLNLNSAYKVAKKIANDIEKVHALAKNELGYLTRCLTNVGSGMRASVMLFLPALSITGKMKEILKSLRTQHITIRGVYGEGSEAGGNMYQISNQSTISWGDDEILQTVHDVTTNLAKMEMDAQGKLFKEKPDMIIDQVCRSWGILTNAHMLTSDEAVEHLVWLKLGTTLDIIKFKNNRIIDDLFFLIQPATLMVKQAITPIERDKARAKQVKEILTTTRVK